MKFHSALNIIFSFFFLLAVTTKSQHNPDGSCGVRGRGAPCPEGLCCSKWGWCGSTPAYCDADNCQSQCSPLPASPPPPAPPGPIECGIQHGGATCPPTMCCTVMGHCANSRGPHCSRELCQSQCGGAPTCGIYAGGVACLRNECCTKSGFCAPFLAPSCMPPFCQTQCPFGPAEPARIAMPTDIV